MTVISSKIIPFLLPDEWTTYSRFKIPIQVDVYFSVCEIKKGTQLARLIEFTNLIIGDKAPINHINYFVLLSRFLKNILRSENIDNEEKLFDEKIIFL